MHIMQLQYARWIHSIFTLCLFVLIALHTNPVNAQSQPVLLVMGDSLSAAYGMETEQGWVALLANKLASQKTASNRLADIQVQNASISGETTAGGLQRLPGLVTQHQPDYVLIELGANDALRGQNLRITERNLQRMIEISQQAGAKVMLLGIRVPPNYGPAYDAQLSQIFVTLAEKFKLPLDPFFLEDVALDPTMMQRDELHPNVDAQPVILERVWPKIQAWLAQ